jgi:hypothetical protein
MFPNPQDALPLPPRPSLERYRKIAKDLVKACKGAGDLPPADDGLRDSPDAVGDWAYDWAEGWVDDLVRLSGISFEPEVPVRVDRWIDQVAGFARRQLMGDAAHERRCALSDAQFVIARSHGFEGWPKFVRALEALEIAGSSDGKFEAAADAIVSGDVAALKRLLDEKPELIRARSMREHGASLLHYVAANGVEGYRQKTPKNIIEITELLLAAGADIDATAEVYGGSCKTLGLAATSVHPERAGLMEDLLRTLLEHGAKIHSPAGGSTKDSIVMSCLDNGRLSSAVFLGGLLVDRGERLGIAEAAAIGRLDLLEKLWAEGAVMNAEGFRERLQVGFAMACCFGQRETAEFLIDKDAQIGEPDDQEHTPLHWAVIGGHLEVVELLLGHDAPLELENVYGGTPLGQGLWSAAHGGDAEVYVAILEALTAAGAKLPERHVPVNPRIDAWLEERGSHAEPKWYWWGERPRRNRR